MDRGERGQLPVRYGIRGVNSGCADLEEVGSCGGRANQVLGAVVLSRGTSARVPGQSETYRGSGTRVIKWSFIVAEIGDDEGILGNDFAMAHELTVRPCEGAVYLPDLSGTRKEHMGEHLPCTIRSVTEVRAVTEETLVVRAVGSATLAPHTVTQVRVIVPTPRARGTVMIEMGPGPLGLCPVRGVVEVEKDSSISLANTGTQPIHIEQNEVIAMAECVLAGPGTNPGNARDDRDEVNGLVERVAPHLTNEECQQLRAAMAARKHLFAPRDLRGISEGSPGPSVWCTWMTSWSLVPTLGRCWPGWRACWTD